MLSEPQTLPARADFEDFAATRSGPPPSSGPRADGPCLGSCLISNKLPVVIRGPANYDHDYDHDDDDDYDDYDGSGEDGQ